MINDLIVNYVVDALQKALIDGYPRRRSRARPADPGRSCQGGRRDKPVRCREIPIPTRPGSRSLSTRTTRTISTAARSLKSQVTGAMRLPRLSVVANMVEQCGTGALRSRPDA